FDEVTLKLWMFLPSGWSAEDNRPAMVFFFGGGWRAGSPNQFVPHAQHLAERGIVSFVADYRVSSRHGTKAKDCVDDAREAVRFIRKYASKFGVDPKRVGAGGGSAGGHLAAAIGTIEVDAASKPAALALFNPATVLAPYEDEAVWPEGREEELKERMGVDPKKLSPIHHVSSDDPPAVVFHGTDDNAVPYKTAEWFVEAMKEAGVKAILHTYEGAPHGFFNYSRREGFEGEDYYADTLRGLDEFLVGLGWLEKEEG
ncbi:MAG: alpha/beta hydrolase, partial [Verrucomicrobiota bacterium]